MNKTIQNALIVIGFVVLSWLCGYNYALHNKLKPGYWVGIEPREPKIIGIVNTSKHPGNIFRASMQRFPLNNGWVVTLNAYGGTSAEQYIATNVPVIYESYPVDQQPTQWSSFKDTNVPIDCDGNSSTVQSPKSGQKVIEGGKQLIQITNLVWYVYTTNTFVTNSVINPAADSAKEIVSAINAGGKADAVIDELCASGAVCRRKGHLWESDSVSISGGINAFIGPETRHCRICGLTQTKVEEWK